MKYLPCSANLFFLLLLSFFLSPLWGQDKPAMQVEDVLALKNISDVQMSPNGQWMVYVTSHMDFEENKSLSTIWLAHSQNGNPVRLTSSISS